MLNNTSSSKGSHVQQGIKVLTFSEKPLQDFSVLDLKVPCIFCEREFPNTSGKNDAVLHHMLIEHQLVIGDVGQVCDLRRYLCHWKTRLKEKPITEVCPVININSKPDGMIASYSTLVISSVLSLWYLTGDSSSILTHDP